MDFTKKKRCGHRWDMVDRDIFHNSYIVSLFQIRTKKSFIDKILNHTKCCGWGMVNKKSQSYKIYIQNFVDRVSWTTHTKIQSFLLVLRCNSLSFCEGNVHMTAVLICNCFLKLQLLGKKIHKLLLHFLFELWIITSTICSQHKSEKECKDFTGEYESYITFMLYISKTSCNKIRKWYCVRVWSRITIRVLAYSGTKTQLG